jgi:DNA modification methylase
MEMDTMITDLFNLPPHYGKNRIQFRCGNVIDALKTLPDESVQCVVTSPPYWGLRNYGIESSIWGGDPDCQHQWGSAGTIAVGNNSKVRGKDEIISTLNVGPKQEAQGRETISAGKLCELCGAWLGHLGLEPTPDLFIHHLMLVFREVKRVLRSDGVLFLNLGDSYVGGGRAGKDGFAYGGMEAQNRCNTKVKWGAPTGKIPGLKPKDLVGIPWMAAFALRADGWWLRSDIIWSKGSCMPESVTDRPTKAHEYIFLLSKSGKYFWNQEAVREPAKNWGTRERTGPAFITGMMPNGQPHGGCTDCNFEERGRNIRTVWTINPGSFSEAHFATFPPKLPEICIKAGTSEWGCCSGCGEPYKPVVVKGTGQIISYETTCTCDTGKIVPCTVLDPFGGACTTGLVAAKLGMNAIMIDLSKEYIKMGQKRIKDAGYGRLLTDIVYI